MYSIHFLLSGDRTRPSIAQIGTEMSQKTLKAARKRWRSLKPLRRWTMLVGLLVSLTTLALPIYTISSGIALVFNPFIAIAGVVLDLGFVAMYVMLTRDYKTLTSYHPS